MKNCFYAGKIYLKKIHQSLYERDKIRKKTIFIQV